MEPKLYNKIIRLNCKVQHYPWGIVGEAGIAGKFSRVHGLSELKDKPCAELWMGAHPNGPSIAILCNDSVAYLSVLIEQNRAEFLGKEISQSFGELPFLLKVLSIQKALSIQSHPDKNLAKELHNLHPNLYPDANHKPEIAIALGQFEALVGFRPLQSINIFLEKFDELQEITKFKKLTSKDDLRECYVNLLTADQRSLEIIIQRLYVSIKSAVLNDSTEEETLFCKLVDEFGIDVGCLSVFFFNYVKLQKGESIFIHPNVPHAYISGEIVECMSASDNVIRAGLTPKFKDVGTLLKSLNYEPLPAVKHFIKPKIISKNSILYETPVDEFSVLWLRFERPGEKDVLRGIDGPALIIIMQGSIEAESGSETVVIKEGEVFFILPGTEINFTGQTESSNLFCAFCTKNKPF